jgi:hypothetical protein
MDSGVVFPLEQQAMNGDEMPRGLNSSQQRLYLSLRNLYYAHRNKIIDRETAVREKKQLIRAYQHDCFMDRCGAKSVAMWRELGGCQNAYRKDRTLENADKLADAMDGRIFDVPGKYQEFMEEVK